MLRAMIKRADKQALQLAPFIGIGCPALIREDGSIGKGDQNLSRDWEHQSFNLPQQLREAIPTVRAHETAVSMHNDAVVQGLRDVERHNNRHWLGTPPARSELRHPKHAQPPSGYSCLVRFARWRRMSACPCTCSGTVAAGNRSSAGRHCVLLPYFSGKVSLDADSFRLALKSDGSRRLGRALHGNSA
jgi:hypothetical protein